MGTGESVTMWGKGCDSSPALPALLLLFTPVKSSHLCYKTHFFPALSTTIQGRKKGTVR